MNLGGVIHLNKTGIIVLCCVIGILFLYSISSKSGEKNDENKVNLRDLLEVSIYASQMGGKQVVLTKDSLKISEKGLTKESMPDRVTNADFLSHCAMVEILQSKFPKLKVISEESKKECEKTNSNFVTNAIFESLPDQYVNFDDLTVWIDPLDATQEYTEKLYKYVTTMVCVAKRDKPIIGVIHNPFNNETSWAWVGKGTSSDLKNYASTSKINTKNIIVSRSHSGQIKEVITSSFKDEYNIVIAGGAGYKALQVAKGNADAYLHTTAIKKWDICAGNAILSAIGGKMTTKFGRRIEYDSTSSAVNEYGLIAVLKNKLEDRFIGKI